MLRPAMIAPALAPASIAASTSTQASIDPRLASSVTSKPEMSLKRATPIGRALLVLAGKKEDVSICTSTYGVKKGTIPMDNGSASTA